MRFTPYGGNGLPWGSEAAELLDELLIEKLPAATAEPIRVARGARTTRREDHERHQRERHIVVAAFVEQASTMTRDER